MPDDSDFSIASSTDLATLLASRHNTTLSEALADGRLYRNRHLDGLEDLPGHNLGFDERYVSMNVRLLLYRCEWVVCTCIVSSRRFCLDFVSINGILVPFFAGNTGPRYRYLCENS